MASTTRRFSVSGRSAAARRDEPQPDRDQHREDELRAPAQPQRPPLDELRVVVGEAQQRARDRRRRRRRSRASRMSVSSRNGTAIAVKMMIPPIVGVPGLGVVALRPLLADVLAELALAQERDELRRQEDADQQRGGARDQDLTHGPAPPRRSPGRSRARPSRARRRPGATSRRDERGRLGRVGGDVRPRRRTPRASPPTAARRRPARQRRTTPRSAPISRCASSSPGPSSSMSPSTATRRPVGRLRGEIVERGAHGERVGVVAVVDDDDARRQRHVLAAQRAEGHVDAARTARRRRPAPPPPRPAGSRAGDAT